MTKEDETKHKGIHDPWRLGTEAWRPPADEVPVGAQGSTDTLDGDLLPNQWYVFRVPGAALKIVGANEPVEAVRLLVKAYKEDKEIRSVLEAVGFTDRVTDATAIGFVFNAPNGVLCCPDAVDTTEGLQRLNKALRTAIRSNVSMKQRLNKWGIIPLVE